MKKLALMLVMLLTVLLTVGCVTFKNEFQLHEPVEEIAEIEIYYVDPSDYSVYDVEITAPGYFTKRINGLTVFSGIHSVQQINMIPGSGNLPEDYPRGNINSSIPENTDLT